MARTVAGTRGERASEAPASAPGPFTGRGACGFCTTKTPAGVRHDFCPGETNTTAPGRKDNVVWKCQCAEKGHQP